MKHNMTYFKEKLIALISSCSQITTVDFKLGYIRRRIVNRDRNTIC